MQEKEAENLQIEGEGPVAGGAVLRRVGAAEEAVLMVVFRAAATTAVGEQHGHPCMMCSTAPFPRRSAQLVIRDYIHRKVKKERC